MRTDLRPVTPGSRRDATPDRAKSVQRTPSPVSTTSKPRKPTWDNTVSDLAQYKLSKKDLEGKLALRKPRSQEEYTAKMRDELERHTKKLSDRLESIATQREQSDEPSEEHTATTASQLLDRTPSPKPQPHASHATPSTFATVEKRAGGGVDRMCEPETLDWNQTMLDLKKVLEGTVFGSGTDSAKEPKKSKAHRCNTTEPKRGSHAPSIADLGIVPADNKCGACGQFKPAGHKFLKRKGQPVTVPDEMDEKLNEMHKYCRELIGPVLPLRHLHEEPRGARAIADTLFKACKMLQEHNTELQVELESERAHHMSKATELDSTLLENDSLQRELTGVQRLYAEQEARSSALVEQLRSEHEAKASAMKEQLCMLERSWEVAHVCTLFDTVHALPYTGTAGAHRAQPAEPLVSALARNAFPSIRAPADPSVFYDQSPKPGGVPAADFGTPAHWLPHAQPPPRPHAPVHAAAPASAGAAEVPVQFHARHKKLPLALEETMAAAPPPHDSLALWAAPRMAPPEARARP